jgi:hypothetical protein
MSEKVKRMAGKSLPFVMIIGLIFLVTGIILNRGVSEESQQAMADTATTSVTIGNVAPTWTVDAQEVVESSISSPTNVGDNVSWEAVADDINGDNYYLLICITSSTPTAHNGGAPDCAGGASYQWAVSTGSATGTTSTATYTTQSSDAENNVWYAFICDGSAGGALCNATYKQGTGNTASPFVVNHRPIFDIISNDGPEDPGGSVTWSTNATTTDPDSYGGQDTIVLHVCQTAGWSTSTNQCTGSYWCSSTAVASNPSCTYNVPTPRPDATYDAYVYLVDNHGFQAAGTYQASNSSYAINNVAPTINAASINLVNATGTGRLVLMPMYAGSSTPGFSVEATIVDNNSCEAYGGGSEITTSTLVYVYRSGIGSGGCDDPSEANPNHCYYISGTCSLGPCGGISDSDATTSCTFSLWFLADPTYPNTGANDTPWFAENWLASVTAVDDDNASSTTESSSGNELERMLAYDLLTTSIPYGTVAPGATSSQATTTIQALGNVGMDENLSGTDMQQMPPGQTIDIEQQHYSTTSGFSYWSGATTTATATEAECNCLKSTSTSSPETVDTYWMILVPPSVSTGVFNGTNTIAAVLSEGPEW